MGKKKIKPYGKKNLRAYGRKVGLSKTRMKEIKKATKYRKK